LNTRGAKLETYLRESDVLQEVGVKIFALERDGVEQKSNGSQSPMDFAFTLQPDYKIGVKRARYCKELGFGDKIWVFERS